MTIINLDGSAERLQLKTDIARVAPIKDGSNKQIKEQKDYTQVYYEDRKKRKISRLKMMLVLTDRNKRLFQTTIFTF